MQPAMSWRRGVRANRHSVSAHLDSVLRACSLAGTTEGDCLRDRDRRQRLGVAALIGWPGSVRSPACVWLPEQSEGRVGNAACALVDRTAAG
jgi:hypothetical protein